jgi:hypothetical protein
VLASLADDVRVAPAFCWVPPHATTAGGEVADLARSLGRDPYPEQQLVLDAMFAEHEDGSNVAFEFGLVCCRQNLKTWCLEVAVLADLFLHSEPLVVWTAHQLDTTKETFRRFKALIDEHDDLSRRVRTITDTNGEWEIELVDGARVKFRARSKGAGRGLSGSKVILDEAYALTAGSMGDLIPTMLTIPDAQVRYASSAGKSDSDVLRGIRDRGRAGGSSGLSYLEWADLAEPDCADDDCDHKISRVDCCVDDPARWQVGNPALGRLITEDRMRATRESLPEGEFVRECLGWWEKPAAHVTSTVDMGRWADLLDRVEVTDGLVMAIDVTRFHEHATIAMAGRRDDGLAQVEVVENRPGSAWVAARAVEIFREHDYVQVILDPSSSAGLVLTELLAAHLPVRLTSFRDYTQACGGFLGLVEAERLRHGGQPELDMAVGSAAQRTYADMWVWNRRNSAVDSSPLIAATLAAWGLGQDDASVYEGRDLLTLGSL